MKILIIAPHPDDEILGVGGTIAKKSANGDEVYVCIVTKGVPPLFLEENTRQTWEECRKADSLLGVKETIFLGFPAVMLETVPRHELNGKLSDLIQEIKPDEVYIPHRGDMQLDHKMISDACMVALRPKYKHQVKHIYAYETLSETGWDIPNAVNEFIPTVYVDITDYIKAKIEALGIFASQLAEFPNARSLRAVEALAAYRGAMVNVEAAESFIMIREIS